MLIVHDKSNLAIDSHFSVELYEQSMTVVVESKGGGLNSYNHRNYNYDLGLRYILERLGALGAILDSVVVDSRQTRQKHLSHEERLVHLPHIYKYPIYLSTIDDFENLRVAVCASQKPIDQKPGAKGGNGQRRIRLFIRAESGSFDVATLSQKLVFLDNKPIYSEFELSEAASEADNKGGFAPDDIEDARKRTISAIVQREGQPKFRNDLLIAYGYACAVTNCNLVEVLEAAHILPFMGILTNNIQNGLLLRSDIHTLFDKGLLAIDTNSWEVLIDPKLNGTEYEAFGNQTLRLPTAPGCWPSVEALRKHRESTNL
jgi:putative restriction endonuclease